jgi:hypothetical protein
MNRIVNTETLASIHRESILQWTEIGIRLSQENFFALVEENHAFNFQLWHAEDRARRDDMGYQFVYLAKREIDGHNQKRNERMEAMDEWLVHRLNPASPDVCPVHSETPGMMIDRLSILALKAYHMEQQVLRKDVEPSHRQNCQKKLETIMNQQQSLLSCLSQLFEDIAAKKRTFKVYHQFKMYNDPTLNPQLYSSEAIRK